MAEALLGFGGNLGDPAGTIRAAQDRLDAAGIRISRRSALYRTPPWGPVAQPDFVNACAAAETVIGPRELLSAVQSVERQLGRTRGLRFGPRIIDIDILAYDDLTIDEPGLVLPHARLTDRAFVLVPLAEIAPGKLIAGKSVAQWLATVDASGIRRISDAEERGGRPL